MCIALFNLVIYVNFLALQSLLVPRLLPSRAGRGSLPIDLFRLGSLTHKDGFDIDQIFPSPTCLFLTTKLLESSGTMSPLPSRTRRFPPCALPSLDQTPYSFNLSSFVNISEYRKYVDGVLKKLELGSNLHIGVPRFYEAFFGDMESLETAAAAVFMKCQKGNNPLYNKELGWRDWPQGAKEKYVLK